MHNRWVVPLETSARVEEETIDVWENYHVSLIGQVLQIIDYIVFFELCIVMIAAGLAT